MTWAAEAALEGGLQYNLLAANHDGRCICVERNKEHVLAELSWHLLFTHSLTTFAYRDRPWMTPHSSAADSITMLTKFGGYPWRLNIIWGPPPPQDDGVDGI